MMELLAPAGSREALVAAVQNGADAVYLGVDDFNARRGARNFSPEDLHGVVAYCHLRGVRVYLTLNTLINDRELHALASTARVANEAGVDAILVQDWGVLDTLRRVVPDMPLHASTQMTVHTLSGVREAARLGISRAVLARELSKKEIAELCRESPIELEVFVHGALCMCYSGQCAMSAVIGQRSGNRGLCAQPCRLPYDGGYPLSLRDNELADYIPELDLMGVSCVKLEGRMKRPEYVAAVTGIYSRLVHERRTPTDEERAQLLEAFSRDGFTDGYYTGNTGEGMFGVRPANARWPEEWFTQLRAEYERENLRTVPVRFAAKIAAAQPMTLLAGDNDGNVVTVTGAVPEAARSHSVTAEEAEQRLRKSGGTAFSVTECLVQIGEGLSVSASALNSLRRDALGELEAKRTAVAERRTLPYTAPESAAGYDKPPRFTVSLMKAEQLSDSLVNSRPDMIYLPIEEIKKAELWGYLDRTRFCAVLPRIYRTRDEAELRAALMEAPRRGISAVSIGNLGHITLTADCELEKRGDISLNVFNSAAIRLLKAEGLASVAVSFELRREQIRDLQKYLPCEAVIYGRLPLMITENRIAAQNGVLTDRRGERFPVLDTVGGRSEIENGKKLYLLDRSDWRDIGLAYARLRFTDESAEECAEILRAHVEGTECPPAELTRGLFYRGVE